MKGEKKKFQEIVVFLFIFFILLEDLSCAENKEERIINTIKLMMGSIQSNAEKNLFSLDYIKYTINFRNFRILRPLEEDLIIKKELNKDDVYVINNLIISFVVDLNVRFFREQNELEDSDRFIEANFSSLIFKVTDDYIDLAESKIDSIHLSSNSKIGKLDYFRNFNLGRNCTYVEIGRNPIPIENTNSTLISIFKVIFEERFYEIKNNVNLLTYDMKNIFSSAREPVTCSEDSKNKYNIDWIQLSKIKISMSDLNINKKENILNINNILIRGTFFSKKYDKNINFDLTFDSSDFILFGKIMMEFAFEKLSIVLEENNEDKDLKEDLLQILKTDFYFYLNDLRMKYFNYLDE